MIDPELAERIACALERIASALEREPANDSKRPRKPVVQTTQEITELASARADRMLRKMGML